MNIKHAINELLLRRDLCSEAMTSVMRSIMSGEATPAQIAGFLVALRAKGETVEEVAAAAKVLREVSIRVDISCDYLVDTCGTGGDGAHTFNISTASAFVVAASGGKVAKHGNRSVSGKSGSADLLEVAGVNINLTSDQVRQCIEDVVLGFLFAQRHNEAMQHTLGPRRDLGVRTIFNLLGPLTNPAGAPSQVVGVFDENWVVPVAKALKELGSHHVLVVHAADGLDEISIASQTKVAELKNGQIKSYTICPEDFGFSRQSLDGLAVTSAEESLQLILNVFNGHKGAARDIVLLNAGAAIYACGLASSLSEGVTRAMDALDSGAASTKLKRLIQFTQTFKASSEYIN